MTTYQRPPEPDPPRKERRKKRVIHQDEAKWYETIDWAGLCAALLALGLAMGLILGFSRWLIQGTALSENGSQLLSGLGGAIVGALATYLGRGSKERNERISTVVEHGDRQEDQEGEEE